TGQRIKITMMVGNHDYDLACNAEFAAKLQQYNIHLDTSLVLIRTIGDKKIWIEHGQQHDEFNAFPDYGKPYALPVGYFITQTFVPGSSVRATRACNSCHDLCNLARHTGGT